MVMKSILSLLISLIFVNSQNVTLPSIYSKEFRLSSNNNRQVYKTYVIYDNKNNTEILYVEFSFNENENENSTQKSFNKINVNWFTNSTLDNFDDKLFYGVANTKSLSGGSGYSWFSDIIICRLTSSIQKRCDDYYMIHQDQESSIESLEEAYLANFQPNLDYLQIEGIDNILDYEANWVIKNNINSYKSLLQYSVTLPSYASDNFDLDLDFRNNVTVFYGRLLEDNSTNSSISKNIFNNQKFEIKRVVSRNYSELLVYIGSSWIYAHNYIIFLFIIVIIIL